MKFFSSFRARLILTIFPVVAGVTTGALILTEWRFTATYQRLFEEQFESQISAVTQAKNRRFNALSSVLEQMSRKPALIQAMKQEDYGDALQDLRPALESLAHERLQNEFMSFVRPALPEGRDERPRSRSEPFRHPGGQSSPYIALIKADGEFVTHSQRERPPPGQPPGQNADAMPAPPDGPRLSSGRYPESPPTRRRGGRIPWHSLRQFEEVLGEQQVGYILVEADDHRNEQVREIFTTPIRAPDSGQFLGAFVFGLPLPAIADRLLNEQSKRGNAGEIKGGILVDGRLVSTTVPDEEKELVSQTVMQALAGESKSASGQAMQNILLPINGIQHRLLYRVLNPESPFPQAVQVNFYSLAPLETEISGLRRNALGLAASALFVALCLVLWISRGLSGPVSKLVAATHEIEHGNFDVRVPVTRDEVGRLARAFNEMAAGLALQEKYRSILNAVADRTVADRLIENREALGGELKDVTMLFCDIRGFTALTEKMPPHEVIALLNDHMTILTQVAYDHGGIVDKFVGDLIMVLFGAPVSTGRDACQAVDCARAMLRARREANQRHRTAMEIGIGIATGSVVAGCMGSDQRLSYTVIGHRVNLASRLCHIAHAGEIVMDAETAGQLAQDCPVTPMAPVQLKGISEPVQVFRIP